MEFDGVGVDDISIYAAPGIPVQVKNHFEPVGQSPSCAKLLSPVNGATVSRYAVSLLWQNTETNPLLPYGYFLRLGTNPPSSILSSLNLFGTNYTILELPEATSFFWQVIPYGVHNISR